MAKKIRVRSKRLDQVGESELSLALWLLAKQGLVEDRTTPPARPAKRRGGGGEESQ